MVARVSRPNKVQQKRYLGLELGGAKNQRTVLAALEFYPREGKVFLLDVYNKISFRENQSSDEALLEQIEELGGGHLHVGVNVPLNLPPCIECQRKTCPQPASCTVPSVKWMREYSKKVPVRKPHLPKFTPYTQRPVELYIKSHVLTKLPPYARHDVDETLGGTKAPLVARMHFLQRHLKGVHLVETSPKLTIANLAASLRLDRRTLSSYRNLEHGAHFRTKILDAIAEGLGIFIYERDANKLAENLVAFDAFISALTALLADNHLVDPPPKKFPVQTGWIAFPKPGVRIQLPGTGASSR